ncbi:Modulator of FtsH protease YccA [Burkholderiales bacterium]|nr:Modulator of FtsH protease YccA [Burkholderiales bacterium]
MDPKLQPVSISGRPAPLPGGTDSLTAERNRVLRNTYWLLALSLLPVVGGAWLGMQLNFVSFFMAAPIMTPLVMFGAMIGMLFVVTLLRNSAWGVAALLGFTFVSGVFLTPILSVAAGLRNGGQLVALAGGMTAAIFFAMATIATVTKRDFSFMGKFLFIGLVLVIVAALANLFFQVPALSLTISSIAVLLFSAYLLYDVSRIVNGGETNYVMATLGIFLSLYNIFVSLLHLLMAFSGQRD